MIKNELNLAGLYKKRRTDGWIIRTYSAGYPYYIEGELHKSAPKEPLYSYSKNYTKFNKDFSLFMWTNEKSPEKIDAHFNKLVKSLKRPQLMEVLNGIKPISFFENRYSPEKNTEKAV